MTRFRLPRFRLFRFRLSLLLLLALVPCLVSGCGGGGGGGGGGGPPPPPPPPFATIQNLGLAVGSGFANAAALGTIVVFTVSEMETGTDLNGDGDLFDQVAHRLDALTDTITNLGYAVLGRILASDQHFALLVPEAGQGGMILNGDADTTDAVWFVYNPSIPLMTGNPFNTLVATPSLGSPGVGTNGGFLFLWSEAAAGSDFTGDMDLQDTILAGFSSLNQSIFPFTNLAYAAGRPLVSRGSLVAVAVSENSGGADRNGDGDLNDIVLVALEFSPGAVFPHFVGGGFSRAIAQNPYALTDGAVVYLIDEASDGNLDRNGDGDSMDAILAVFDIATAGGETLPLNGALAAPGIAGSAAVGIATSGNRAVVAVDERAQGQIDLNADMDFFDSIAAWIDTAAAPGTLHLFPFTLAARPHFIDGTRGLLLVNERSMGILSGIDLNSDGDDADDVLFLLDAASAPGTLTNLGFAAGPVALAGSDALVGIPEASQAGIDRNGDGDANDTVLLYFDLADTPPTLRGTGLAALANSHFRFAPTETRVAVMAAEGQSPTFDRINGDGDSTDNAILLLHFNPSVSPPLALAPTPFFAGTASAFVAPPLRAGNRVWVFATSEAMAGGDRNGDGDLNDTVLSSVRLSAP